MKSSWFLLLNLEIKLLLNLESSWFNLDLELVDSILKSFSWAFCHHFCYHQNYLNQLDSSSWSLLLLFQFTRLSQPTLRREGDAGLTGASSKGGIYAESPPTFIRGKHRKNRKRCGLWTLSVKGSWVVYTHGEGISTPCVRHKGRQPLIKCAISCLWFVSFSLVYVSMCFYAFYIFYLFVFDKGVSLVPTYPRLRWGNETYVVIWELNVG